MQVLDDLYTETKRLFIAGSKFAKGDPRVLKYIPVLEKMGESAPVMKKLAEKYKVLVDNGQPDALSDAGMFLYAVRATQGETAILGEITETAPSIYELPKTATSYLSLKPVLDALTLSKQGRYEVIKSAFTKGLFNDFRLYGPLVKCLDDKYSELADYIYKIIIPSIGAPIIPYILEQYNPDGKRSDAMRLSLLDKLGYENIEQLAFYAVEEGDLIVAVEGIKILGVNPKNEEYLLTLANDKKSDVREAALCGLIRMDSIKGKELMMKTLKSGKYKSAVEAAKACRDREYTEKLLELIRPYYDKLFEKGLSDKDFIKSNQTFTEFFSTLENKDDPAVYELFTEVLTNKYYGKRLKDNRIYYYNGDVRYMICNYLTKCPSDKAVKVFEKAMGTIREMQEIVAYYFHAAVKVYTRERLYDIFSKFYVSGQLNFNQMFGSDNSILFINQPYPYNRNSEAELEKIRSLTDIRWKRLFIQKRDMPAMHALLCEGDEYEQEMKNAILKQAKEEAAKKTIDANIGYCVCRLAQITKKKKSGLFKGELEKAAEICYEIFEKIDGLKAEYFYDAITKESFLKIFYPDYCQKFKELAKRKTSRVFKQIIEAFEEVMNQQ